MRFAGSSGDFKVEASGPQPGSAAGAGLAEYRAESEQSHQQSWQLQASPLGNVDDRLLRIDRCAERGGPPPVEPPAVLPAAATPPFTPKVLPATGSSMSVMLAIGVLMVAAGAMIVALTRRRVDPLAL